MVSPDELAERLDLDLEVQNQHGSYLLTGIPGNVFVSFDASSDDSDDHTGQRSQQPRRRHDDRAANVGDQGKQVSSSHRQLTARRQLIGGPRTSARQVQVQRPSAPAESATLKHRVVGAVRRIRRACAKQ